MQILIKVKSPYVCAFYGACFNIKVCLVMELCVSSLWHILENEVLTWENFLQWTLDLVRGLKDLHLLNPPILHRDLKPLNLLLDNKHRIKIGDFGLSRSSSELETLTKLKGTLAYTAPELYFQQIYTVRSDIYSVGIILWELVYKIIYGVHQNPFEEYDQIYSQHSIQILHQAATKNLRPTIPQKTPELISNLIKECWSHSPKGRPSSPRMIEKLNLIQFEYKRNKQEWNDTINIYG